MKTEHITQEKAVELTGRLGQFSTWNVLSEDQIHAFANTVIQWAREQQAKGLPELPE